jgi:hypothetical protein
MKIKVHPITDKDESRSVCNNRKYGTNYDTHMEEVWKGLKQKCAK